MVAQLDTPLGPLTVANPHLSFVPGWNRAQLRRLVRTCAASRPTSADGRYQYDPADAEPLDAIRSPGEAPTYPPTSPVISWTTS